jgi:hypothetical protein
VSHRRRSSNRSTTSGPTARGAVLIENMRLPDAEVARARCVAVVATSVGGSAAPLHGCATSRRRCVMGDGAALGVEEAKRSR